MNPQKMFDVCGWVFVASQFALTALNFYIITR